VVRGIELITYAVSGKTNIQAGDGATKGQEGSFAMIPSTGQKAIIKGRRESPRKDYFWVRHLSQQVQVNKTLGVGWSSIPYVAAKPVPQKGINWRFLWNITATEEREINLQPKGKDPEGATNVGIKWAHYGSIKGAI
jgi:glyoxylate utilization-related uncharacterized protein